MSGNHEHGDVRALPESRLWIAFALTGTFMVIEIVGGLWTGSLALVSDAMHMMTDAIALLLALIAIRAGRKAADLMRTYGYARFEILAAAIIALVLLGVAFYILYQAWRRLEAPPDIQSAGMLAVAIGFMVFPRTWVLLRECINLLLEGVPPGMSLSAVRDAIAGTDGETVRLRIERRLQEDFDLHHTTLQVERSDRSEQEHIH